MLLLTLQPLDKGSVIKVTKDDGLDFRISVKDGLSNQGLGVVYKEVDSITELPKDCFDGFKVKVIGDANISQDDYYVEFETKDDEEFGNGSWVECTGWAKDGLPSGQLKRTNR